MGTISSSTFLSVNRGSWLSLMSQISLGMICTSSCMYKWEKESFMIPRLKHSDDSCCLCKGTFSPPNVSLAWDSFDKDNSLSTRRFLAWQFSKEIGGSQILKKMMTCRWQIKWNAAKSWNHINQVIKLECQNIIASNEYFLVWKAILFIFFLITLVACDLYIISVFKDKILVIQLSLWLWT